MSGYQAIGLGTVANDQTGDQARVAGGKINTQFQEIYGFVGVAPLLVMNDSTQAAANRGILNTALAAGGLVTPSQIGDIYIDQPLIGYSNTWLLLGPGTNIRLKAASNCPMFMPSSLQAALNGGTTLTGGSSVTLTQGTGCAVSVALTGHGFVVGDGAWLYGSTVVGYNGVFRVVSVTDANNFVVYTDEYQATAPSGTILCTKAVVNCRVGGGTWNYDGANQTNTANSYNSTAVYGVGMIDCGFEGVSVQGAFHFSFHIQAVRNFDWKNLFVQKVGLGIYGPCSNVRGDGLGGATQATFLTIETFLASPANSYQFSHSGNVIDVNVKGAIGTSTSGGLVQIIASDAEHMDAINLEEVFGVSTTGAPIQVSRMTGTSVGSIGRLTFKNCAPVANAASTPVFSFSNSTIDILTIEHCSTAPGNTAGASANNWLAFTGGVVCNEICFEKIRSNYQPSSTGSPLWIYVNGLTWKDWNIKNCVVTGATTGNFHLVNYGSTSNQLGKLTFEGGFYDAACNELVYCNALPASGAMDLAFRNVKMAGSKYMARTSVSVQMNVTFEGCTMAPVTSLLSTNAANTVNIYSAEDNTITYGTTGRAYESTAVSGTVPVFNLYGLDLFGDQASVGRAKGVYFWHSSTASGHNATAQQGPCFCPDSATLWATGTASGGLNTLI